MTNGVPVQLSDRDRSLLQLLSWTPGTTSLLQKASRTFAGGPFADERRLRERLQALERVGFARHWSTATIGGGLQNYYKVTPAGFQALQGPDAATLPRAFFAEIAPSAVMHTLALAEVIVTTVCAAHDRHIAIVRFYRENELTFPVGDTQVQPDCFVRFAIDGRSFNAAVEIDQGTETINSPRDTSLRHRLAVYHGYQQQLLQEWLTHGRRWERPRFRVVFLTTSVERAYHVLSLTARINPHPARRLVYAATRASYLGDADPLRSPLFLDHAGGWQPLINLHPSSPSLRAPVRLPQIIEPAQTAW